MTFKLTETVEALKAALARAGKTLPARLSELQSDSHTERKFDDDRKSEPREDHRSPVSDQETERYLSPEEQVVRYLSEHSNGKIKQATLVEELAWSPAKTSRVLSAMEEHDRILRHRIGKQKCVYLPGSEPDILRNAP